MSEKSSRRIMHIDLDAFFVAVEQVLDPELRGKPVVVGGRPERRGVVAAASYEARAFGVHSAMPLITAFRLCPQAIFIQGDFARYREASQKFMAILADFSPYLEPLGIDEAYLDVTGFESLHGSIRRMAEKIKSRVTAELGLCASIGIAGGKVVAKIASELSKPNGLLEVPPGEERSFLAPLPVGRLPGVGKKTGRILNGLGIRTIGQLAAMPASTLRSRFGVWGETVGARARGIDDRPVEPPAAARSVSRETTFAADSVDAAFLSATLHYLSERVGAEIREKGKLARCVTLKLRYADFTTITRQQTLSPPTDAHQALFDAGQKMMEKELTRQKLPVRLIGIGVSRLVEAGRQRDMLDTSAQRMEKLNPVIDRIRRKYGFAAIQTGRTFKLKDIFPESPGGYTLHTPGLSR